MGPSACGMSSEEEESDHERLEADSDDDGGFNFESVDDPEESEQEEGAQQQRTGFSKIMGGVLDRKISGAAPVLALKPSAVTKITEREAERRDQAIASRVKKEIGTQNAA